MIFVTVGTQAPFERFVKAMDEIAGKIEEPVVAQVFDENYKSKNMETYAFISPEKFSKLLLEARLIVSHAGTGTILSALENKIPIIVMPRLASLGEHRNEHQTATVRKFLELGYVYSANNLDELEKLIINDKTISLHQLGKYASTELTESLHDFFISNAPE
ncbi:glycosyltransferase [Mangrovibacterium diazotrophicum]|uniref:UDP-N-acetylglucosamine transferase subunit ALG13 n=1 Tax=Mangrovibacterium diazotrophicum TaxID=1261403 RepID=A0A419W959_9BACT|nr:glycosyltransferase [Mangrovibacterium diazotrophicum]RKD92005.1 UDP-N-acetylglucosamine transferase subunit ALG13 [Mangrovibacterium diazotrophicum]